MSEKPKKIDAFIVAKAGSKIVFVTPEEIKKLVRRGLITGDDLVYRKNLKVWTPARDVKGLRSLIKRIETGELPLSKSAIQPALVDSGRLATPKVLEP
ncbi:MAG: GYF domain-containing protein, partial [Gemmataceae bacterium]